MFIAVPTKYNDVIVKIVQWHLKAYEPDMFFNHCLIKLLNRFSQKGLGDEATQIEKDTLYNEPYCLYECFSDATNNIAECGVSEDLVWEIHDWIAAERRK